MKITLDASTIFLSIGVIIVLTIAAFFEKIHLRFMLPVAISFMFLNYYQSKKKLNIYLIISMLSLMICDYLIFSNLVDNFTLVCITIGLYFTAISITIKQYFSKIKLPWIKLISWSFFISLALLIYLIVSISTLIVYLLPNATMSIILAVIPLLVYTTISYYIYVSDAYKHGIKLLFSNCLSILAFVLTPINELLYPSPIFTVFIVSAQLTGVYLFMQFMIKTKPTDYKLVVRHI